MKEPNMPTRTINLKLITGKTEKNIKLRKALWTTHSEINAAVKELENVLLLCRGRSYRVKDINDKESEIPESSVVKDALSMVRNAQEQNGKSGAGKDEEVLDCLKLLYQKIIPSSELDEKGNVVDGDAQASGAWVGPLMDPKSEGGLSVFGKILDPLPAWFAKMENAESGWEESSTAWLKTKESQDLQKAPGSPSAWVRRLREGKPWQKALVDDQKKKNAEGVNVKCCV